MIPIMMIVIIATVWSGGIQDGVLRSVRRAKFYNERNYQSAKTLMSVIYRYFILYSVVGMFRVVGDNQYVVPFLISIFFYFHKGVIRLQSMIKKVIFSFNPPIPWKYRWQRYKKLYLRIVKEQRTVFEFYRYFPSTAQMLWMIVLLSLIIILFAYKTGLYTAQNQTYFYTVKMEKKRNGLCRGLMMTRWSLRRLEKNKLKTDSGCLIANPKKHYRLITKKWARWRQQMEKSRGRTGLSLFKIRGFWFMDKNRLVIDRRNLCQ